MGRDKSQKEIIISTGLCSFHFHGFFPEDRIKGGPSRKSWNQSKLANAWNAHFPFGNSIWEFWSTFQEIPFSRENFRSGRQNSSFHLHSIRNFRIFWVNQPIIVLLYWTEIWVMTEIIRSYVQNRCRRTWRKIPCKTAIICPFSCLCHSENKLKGKKRKKTPEFRYSMTITITPLVA